MTRLVLLIASFVFAGGATAHDRSLRASSPGPDAAHDPNGVVNSGVQSLDTADAEAEGLLSDCTKYSGTDCLTCVQTPQLTDFGKVIDSTPCRWCPVTQECHAYGSLFDGACSIPIHTNDVSNKDYAEYVCKASEYPHIASDFSNTDIDALEQWVIQYLNNFAGEKHAFPTHSGKDGEDGILTMDNTAKIAVASDWGSGTWESAAVASLMKAKEADYTMHLGDVYYEVRVWEEVGGLDVD